MNFTIVFIKRRRIEMPYENNIFQNDWLLLISGITLVDGYYYGTVQDYRTAMINYWTANNNIQFEEDTQYKLKILLHGEGSYYQFGFRYTDNEMEQSERYISETDIELIFTSNASKQVKGIYMDYNNGRNSDGSLRHLWIKDFQLIIL